jgi:penicillin-binding protein 2
MHGKRIILIMAVGTVLMLLLGARLFQLQVIEASKYAEDSDRKRRRIELVPSVRGRILDRTGSVLACDRPAYTLVVIPVELRRALKVVFEVAALAKLDAAELQKRVDNINERIATLAARRPARERAKIIKREGLVPYEVAKDIPEAAAYEIELHPETYPGFAVLESSRRSYPHGAMACHVIGYTGMLTEREFSRMEKDGTFERELADLVGDAEWYESLKRRGAYDSIEIGRGGVEAFFDARLRGKRGVCIVERDVTSRAENVLRQVDPVPGEDVLLTIDANLQASVEAAIKGKKAAVVVMDVTNGEILAMASSPGFDLNTLVPPVSQDTLKATMLDTQNTPMLNRAAGGTYPLGSVFKIVTATAALEANVMNSQTEFNCGGCLLPDKPDRFRCWLRTGHGPIAFREALKQSCNIYFYKVAELAGHDALIDWAQKYGYGRRTGVELREEQPGILPGRQWLASRGTRWNIDHTRRLSIGQGELTVNVVQVARMTAAVANGGKLVVPHLLLDARMESADMGVTKETLSKITDGMAAVVAEVGGTANKSDLKLFSCAGKTSTAEVSDNPNTPETQAHAWFTGYAPLENPKIAISVVVEHGGKGGDAAAGVAAAILAAEHARGVK